MSYKLIGVLLASLSASACATYTPPQALAQSATSQLSAGYAVPRDELLGELVDFAASSSIFLLENVDSQSGMVFLRFITDTPHDYVDCGDFSRPWIPFRYYNYRGPYKDLLLSKLDSGVSILVVVALSEISPKKTKIIVSGRFELQSRQESSFVWTYGRIMTWKFTSGSPVTNQLQRPAWGSGAARTCQSNLEAESVVMGLIGELTNGLAVVRP
jgi:hypothetical protein